MNVWLHPAADQELIAAATYYAQNASRQLAEDFIAEFDRAVALIAGHPGLGTPWRGEARRFPLRRFPYSVIYHPVEAQLRVVAVAHQRRKPGYWAERL